MGKKNDKAPKAPDPVQTAKAQTQMNIDTALAQNAINQVNQVGPDGSLTYAQTGTRMVNGRAIPVYTATTKLSDAQQGIKTQSDAAEFNLAKLANNQSAFLNDYMGKPVDLSSGNIENYVNDHFMDDFNKTWDQDRSSLETKLANSGIRMGSDAYTRAMSDFSNSKSNARDNLYGNQYDRALQSLLTERNQPLNEITALLSGSQVSQPNFVNTPQSSVANTDFAGLVNQNYQNQLAAYNAKQQQQNSMLGGMFGLAGNVALAFSDKRLKKDIEKIGETKDDLGIYAFKYRGDDKLRIGLMAQEVEKKNPDAVVRHGSGYRMVDYGKALHLGEGAH